MLSYEEAHAHDQEKKAGLHGQNCRSHRHHEPGVFL